MIKLSVVIITFNEEQNIGRCLQSVQSVADEIIVVDSYSTDKTEAICKQYQVSFLQHSFEGHIEQKNYALSHAAYDYVLSLDADEALSPDLQQDIMDIKSNWTADGYTFNRLTNYCGKWIRHCGWYPDKKLRLFKRNKASWGGVNPHDKVEMHKQTTVKHIQANLLHYSFYTIREHIEQINKFSTIKAEGLFKKGKKSHLCKMIFSSWFKFFKGYVLKLGFLDGIYGLIICANSGHANFLKYSKLWSLHKQKRAS